MVKKKTIAASAALGTALSYLAFKWVDKQDCYNLQRFSADNKAVDMATKILDGCRGGNPEKKKFKVIGIIGALCITAGLIYQAHQHNLFGEKEHII